MCILGNQTLPGKKKQQPYIFLRLSIFFLLFKNEILKLKSKLYFLNHNPIYLFCGT